MSMIQSDLLLGQEGGAGYVVERSLRFSSSDSAYLSRTPASAGNRKTWTWAGWVKLGKIPQPDRYTLFECTVGFSGPDSTYALLNFNASGQLGFGVANGGSYTTAVFRDPSAWYHVVAAVDTTQATASDRLKLYVNGIQYTHSGYTYSQNLETAINSTNAHSIGMEDRSNIFQMDGYLTDIHFIDGQALDPTSFGEFDTNGVWQPIAFTPQATPNDGRTWSSYSGALGAAAFDGSLSTAFNAVNNTYYYIAASITINSSLRIYARNDEQWQFISDQQSQLNLAVAGSGPSYAWISIPVTGTHTNPRVRVTSGGSPIYAVEIDGVVLIDGNTTNIGTNGFHLDFADNSSAAALGYDAAGSNDWTVNNLSVAAGAGNDSLRDSPTNGSQTDTGVGGEVVGNYCTLNPLAKTAATTTLSNGNLEATGDRNSYGTFAIPSSGKWYWEVTPTAGFPMIGVTAYVPTSTAAYNDAGLLYAAFNGDKWVNGTNTSYGASYTSNDVVGVAVNVDAGTVTFYKNNTSQGSITYAAAGLFPASTTGGGSATLTFNFGQRPFAYTAPSGFKALCTTNLPAPVVAKPSEVFNVVTGNFDTTKTWTVGFNPDLIWIKSRSNADGHVLTDSVRGTNAQLQSNTTGAELTNTTAVTSFNSDGFTIGSYGLVSNTSTVAWCWDAGSSTVTNTQGSITSQVRANPSAGFSIVTYTGNGSNNQTVGHGLGVQPHMVVIKSRSNVNDWLVFHQKLPNTDYYLKLNSSAAQTSTANILDWSSSTLSFITANTNTNSNGYTYVAYCFAPVAGYSSFGSYTGNGSADGPFVFCGFRPRFLLVKRSNIDSDWWMYDTARSTFNAVTKLLYPNASAAEGDAPSAHNYDFTANGFKLRMNHPATNGSGDTYVYAAFAESPFQYARAR